MNAPVQVDQYDFWRRRLKGEVIPIHDGEPQAGFYRNGAAAVAYWFGKDGKIRCRVDNKDVPEQDAMERWPFASKKPVSHEAYKAKLESGDWPSESDVVTADIEIARTDPNAGTFEGLQKRIKRLAIEADRLIAHGAAIFQEDADRASDIADRLGKLWTQSDNLRKVEKQPHLDAERAVDDKWRPVLTNATIYKRLKEVVVEPLLKAKKREKEQAEQAARDAAERARLEAEEAVRKAAEAAKQANAPNELIEQQAAQAQAAAAAAAARVEQVSSQRVTAGTRGRSVHLRSAQVVTIEDRAAVLAHFADREEITAVLQTLAERSVKAGIAVPGVKVSDDASAT